MKKVIYTGVLLSLLAGCSAANQSASSQVETTPVSILIDTKTNWNFVSEEVAKEDLDTILKAGVNSPSALNAKTWQFNVITDAELIAELADGEGSKSAPVMIIVSVDNSNEMKILDAGLATEAMQVTAQLLGYATKIETAPARTIRNDETGKYAKMLGIGEDKSARAALFIGKEDNQADAVTSATESADISSYVKYNTGE